MPTINQLVKRGRVKPKVRNKVPALEASPQKEECALGFTQQLQKNQTQHYVKLREFVYQTVLKLLVIFQAKDIIYKNTQ